MYNVPHFKDKDQHRVLDFIRQNSFAFLVANAQPYPAATQVPLLLEEREGLLYLKGHIMRQTGHHKALLENPKVLCVFTGAHAYVSASLYTNPQAVSTWNYMSVHVNGHLNFLNDEGLLALLEETTRHYENNEDSPASFHHLPKDMVQKASKAIVGFEIAVEKIEHVFKLSQNRDAESYANIIRHLEEGGDNGVTLANEMKKRRSELF
jgi:transcriptional regulator